MSSHLLYHNYRRWLLGSRQRCYPTVTATFLLTLLHHMLDDHLQMNRDIRQQMSDAVSVVHVRVVGVPGQLTASRCC